MNALIRQYFETIEERLIQSSMVISYQVRSQEITPVDGKLRLKVSLNCGDSIELFEYVKVSHQVLQVLKYSFHWQDQQGQLKQRWDNAPHFPHLPNAPHHVHLANGAVESLMEVPNILGVLEYLEEQLDD
jgi:hypothetical protein